MKKFWISFIALLMGVVIGVGIWHGIAYKDNLTSFVKDTRSKIESVFVNKDNVSSEEQKPSEDQPTPDKPSEEQPGPEEPGPEEPHVHKLSEWNIVNEPICITVGAERRWCDCGYYEERDIPALGHDYVDGVCSRCGESDPNHVVAPVSLDGMYYFITPNGTVCVNQIEGDKFTQFIGYFKNGEQSVIYLPQDYETYIDVGYTLSITETDANIVASIVEIPSWGEVFNYDKITQTLYFGGSLTTKITNFEILPYEEPRIYVENDVLHMTDMTGVDGTYTVYYRFINGSIDGEISDSYFEEQVYVAGNVSEFDLSLLINRESVPMLEGCTYQIRVMFETADGFLIRGYESIEYTVPNVEICEHDWVEDLSYVPTAPSCGQYWDSQYICSKCNETKLETNGPLPHDYVNGVCSRCGESDPNSVSEITLSIDSSTNEDFWLLFDVSSVKEYLLSEDLGNTSGFVFEVFLENSITHETNKLLTQTLSLSDFNYKFGVDSMFASYYSQGNYNLAIVISSSTNFKIDGITPVSFNHDGSHYLLTLSA